MKAFMRAARPRSFDAVVGLVATALELFSAAACANLVRHCGYRISTTLIEGQVLVVDHIERPSEN